MAPLDIAFAIELVGIADLLVRNLEANADAVLGARVLQPRFELIHGFVPGSPAGAGEGGKEHGNSESAHGVQRFFGSIAIRRWRACHSWSGYFPPATSRKR